MGTGLASGELNTALNMGGAQVQPLNPTPWNISAP